MWVFGLIRLTVEGCCEERLLSEDEVSLKPRRVWEMDNEVEALVEEKRVLNSHRTPVTSRFTSKIKKREKWYYVWDGKTL